MQRDSLEPSQGYVEGKFADAALGHFDPKQSANPFIAAIEGKGESPA